MHGNVINDLLPLYIDGCCSEETKKLVENHTATCPDCKEQLVQMRQEIGSVAPPYKVQKKPSPILLWKASVLQVALFFCSFVIMVWGVSWEARVPAGLSNGWFALNLVIPVTAFMLSLGNWFFVQQYRSKKMFCICSCVLHVVVYLAALLWGLHHYGWLETPFDVSSLGFYMYMPGIGAILTVFLDVLLLGLSNVYAKLLGKE